jgi:hypothetical protein
MKKFSHLDRNMRPVNQPEGSYPFGKNGVQNYVIGSVINEPGFLPSAAIAPYIIIGIIETDKFPVIISTNNTNSAVGYFDTINDVYVPIINDSALSFKLNLSTNFFVTGQAQRNYKSEVVIAFTDKNQVPFYLNCDNPQVTSLDDIKLFPNNIKPTLNVAILPGGNLQPGAYYVAVKYIAKDGTETAYLAISAPEIVTGTQGTATDKSLQITVGSIDPKYNQVQFAIISKVNGQLTATQLITPVAMIGNGMYVFTGSEVTEDITLDEILVPPAVYNRVGAIGQLNDALYIVDLDSPKKINMQKYANLVRLKCASKLISVSPVYEPMTTGKEKSFAHREVYAFYIKYNLTSGRTTEGFPIPGPDLTVDNLATSAIASAESVTAKKYQVEDTIASFDLATKTCSFGVWQNTSETYPNTTDFDSSTIGGRDLRNQPVLHHRFPSVRWCKENFYSGEPEYGKSMLDMLGIIVENVIIPAEYATEIIGWEIYFAKRSVANSTVLGQSLLLFGQRASTDIALNPAVYYSAGGNFNSQINWKSVSKKPLYLDESVFHFHAFDILFNRPSAEPAYLTMELKEQRLRIPYTDGYMEDGAIGSPTNAPLVYKLDYMNSGEVPTIPSVWFKSVKDTQYVPNNSQVGKWVNTGIETFFGGTLKNPTGTLIPGGEISLQSVNPDSVMTYTPVTQAVQKESTFLSNLMMLRTNMFVPFNGQALVRAAQSTGVLDTTAFYKGDMYIGEYTFHTYGRWEYSGETSLNGDPFYQGTKVARRFICETAANLYSRFEIPGNIYSKYFPKNPLTTSVDANYLTPFIRTNDPNQFGYSKDSNALDDLVSSDIFNTFEEDVYQHPYRIHRGGKLSRQTKTRSWKTFLPLDYYEAQKNMGRFVNVEGIDDRLLLHFENSLMLTQDKAKLETDIIAITLGSGDIFQFEPQEGLSAKLGYAGTQHQLACVRTPFGYMYPDTKEGLVFTYKGGLDQMNLGLNSFFRENLRLDAGNSFTGNGITIGYDQKFKRLLMSVKNVNLNVIVYRKGETFDSSWIPDMSIGDVVYKDGRYQKFLGVNATMYSCPSAVVPVVNDFSVTISETTAVGTLIGTITGTNVLNFVPLESYPGLTITSDGKITVTGPLNFFSTPDVPNRYVIDVKGISSDGSFDIGTATIILTKVTSAPTMLGTFLTIPDTTLAGTVIYTMVATDREALPLTYSIVSGNDLGVFGINAATGELSVVAPLIFSKFRLVIGVTNGTASSEAIVKVFTVSVTQGDLIMPSITPILFESAVAGDIVTVLPEKEETTLEPIFYTFIDQTVPGAFEYIPATREIKVLSAPLFVGTATHTLNFQGSKGYGTPLNFPVVISRWTPWSNVKFRPAGLICAGTDASWTDIEAIRISDSAVLNSCPNDPEFLEVFQGFLSPLFAPVIGSALCGGATVMYFSAACSVTLPKNDCAGSSGELITVSLPDGLMIDFVSQANADNAAIAYLETIKQAMANTYGKCL